MHDNANNIAISVQDLSKCYQVFDDPQSRLLHAIWPKYKKGMEEVWALKNIEFEIKEGEAVALIGCNGSGKSTLLEILTGTLRPSTGTVTVHGRISALLELGSGFNPEYSGRDNVLLNGLLLGLSKKDILSRFSEIEAFAEIGTAIDRPVKTYSSGMMMRLAFAVQVLCDPDILIIDEALSVGDFFFQQKCLSYIRELRAKGVTLLFVSHDMGTVRDLCPRVLYLKQGDLLFDGSSGDGIPLFFREQNTQPDHAPTIEYSKVNKLNIANTNQLEEIKTNSVWINPSIDNATEGTLLAVAFFDEKGLPRTSFKIGEKIRISIAYLKHSSFSNQIIIGLENKMGQLITATGSCQLGIEEPKEKSFDKINYFDIWLSLMLEAGNYSVTVTLGYKSTVNLGERLDQSPAIGPIQITWDYSKDEAPFFGQFGLPVQARFRKKNTSTMSEIHV